MEVTDKKKTTLPNANPEVQKNSGDSTVKDKDYGYVKEILTERDVYTSGIIYRYINNVDPNKDLITDTAKYGGPLKIETVYDYPKK